MLVVGDPGIGQTRLVEELASEAERRGLGVHWGRSWEGDGAPAFWPWVQILRALVAEPDAAALAAIGDGARRELAALVPELEGASDPALVDPSAPRFRLFDGITRFVSAVAVRRPLLLVLEDLHWADAPSVLLLRFLVRHAGGAPPLVVATYRGIEVDESHPLADPLHELARHGESVTLGGLAPDEVAQYLDATIGGDHGHALAARLHRDTEGHPFFLSELVRLLETADDHAAALATVPDGVRALVARRVRRQSAACRALLAVAAVIGREFPLAILRRVAERDDPAGVLELLDEAVAARLVAPPTTSQDPYRFTHALIREALYADVPFAERTRLHRHVGEAIEASGVDRDAHAATLAHHFVAAAADGDPTAALDYCMRAGQQATAVLAHEEAVRHYQRAVALCEARPAGEDARLANVLLELGFAHIRAGDPGAAEAVFLRTAALTRTLDLPEPLARAALGLGEIDRLKDRIVPLLEEALAALDPADSVLRARLLSRLSIALYWEQPEMRKRALSEDAVAMARRLAATRKGAYVPTLCYALSSRIAALSGPDDVETRLAASSEMTALAEQCGNRELALVGRGWSIADALALGDIHHVRWGVDVFTAAAADARHPYYVWWAAALRTMLAIVDGRLADAETLAHETFALGQRAVATDAMQVFAGHHYFLCMEQERHDRLEPTVRAIVDQFPDIPGGHCALALLHADRGRFAEAAAEIAGIAADRFAALPRNPEWLSSVAALAQTSALLPGAPHAATLRTLLMPYRRRVIVAGMGVLCSGSVAHFLGILATSLGRWDEAAACLDDAVDVHERLEAGAWLAYSRYEHARMRLMRDADGDAERAAVLAGEARQFAEEHGMLRLQRKLAELPLRAAAGPRVAPVSPPSRSALLRKEGEFWQLGWDASQFRLRDRVGLHYLATLIGSPSREFLAIDLVRTPRGDGAADATLIDAARDATGSARGLVNADAFLDQRAELAYRVRMEELRTTIAEARQRNDRGRVESAEHELDALTRELQRSAGLGGRGRDSRSPIERARVSATRAIRVAIRLIQENDRAYGRHLAVTIKTGTFCSYVPDPELSVSWQL